MRASHRATQDDVERLSECGVTDLVVAPWEKSSDAVIALEAFAELHLSAT